MYYLYCFTAFSPFNTPWILTLLQKSAQTVLRGCEELCGSPRVRTLSTSRAPPLLSRLSETSSVDESMSDMDSVPCSPLTMPCSPPARIGICLSTFITLSVDECSLSSCVWCLYVAQAWLSLGLMSRNKLTVTAAASTRWEYMFNVDHSDCIFSKQCEGKNMHWIFWNSEYPVNTEWFRTWIIFNSYATQYLHFLFFSTVAQLNWN